MTGRDIVVIGASWGGMAALSRLCSDLPEDFPASVFVVQHVGAGNSTLPNILRARGPLDAVHPADKEQPVRGKIYVAPPDRHMLLEEGRIRLTQGPKENHTRPAIDPLFRSAALGYGPKVIGVVLTGNLDDGTAGMQAIKACGGVSIVQDPDQAEARDMPDSVLENVEVDHCVGIDELASVLVSLTRPTTALDGTDSSDLQAPVDLVLEHMTTLPYYKVIDKLEVIGQPCTLVCPECTGALWEIKGSKPPRYRCPTGHAYSLRSLAHRQNESAEAGIWSALRSLQDLELIMRKVARHCNSVGDSAGMANANAEATHIAAQADVLKRSLKISPFF